MRDNIQITVKMINELTPVLKEAVKALEKLSLTISSWMAAEIERIRCTYPAMHESLMVNILTRMMEARCEREL